MSKKVGMLDCIMKVEMYGLFECVTLTIEMPFVLMSVICLHVEDGFTLYQTIPIDSNPRILGTILEGVKIIKHYSI